MDLQQLDPAAILAQIRAAAEAAPRGGVPGEEFQATARWLCVSPAWSPPLAAACGLPGWEAGDGVIARWRAARLVDEAELPPSLDEEVTRTEARRFWMPRETQTRWVSRLLAAEGPTGVRGLVAEIGARVAAASHLADVPPAMVRWGALARHVSTSDQALRDAFDGALDDALGQNRPDQAVLWLEALQRLEETLRGSVTTLHQRGVRRIGRFDRQRNDRAFLAHYLPRADQFEAYRALIDGQEGTWALHYLGGGGVGKTMLMRCLTSGTSEHFPPGYQVPRTITARIDFDHINPDYPSRRPGQLIAQLAEELRLSDDTGRASEVFGLVFSKVALLHELQDQSPAMAADALDEVLDVFASPCRVVAEAHDARVVLLLDTCEELARLGPDGQLPDSVERMFDLVTALHDRLPSLRVVLCGRRPLAGTYAGGVVLTADLPPRAFLRLQRIQPFDEKEAREYLQREAVVEGLMTPILARSHAAASPGGGSVDPVVTAPRFSPFSLSVYAGWVSRQPNVTAEDIASDRVDHFVKIRILDRIHNADVRHLLPHIALLGRFDEPTLRACADVRADLVAAVLREIASQEWVDRQAGGYYLVEPELRERLVRHFGEVAPGELQEARRRVLPLLRAWLEQPSIEAPDEAHVTSLMALLAHDPAGLLACWRTLDARIVQGGHAAWGARVLGRLLAEGGALAAASVDEGAWGAFVTTLAECVLSESGPRSTANLWRRAWDATAALPDGAEREALHVRIAAGAVQQNCLVPDSDLAVDLWVLRLSNLLGSPSRQIDPALQCGPVLAAMMACADATEQRADPLSPPPMVSRLTRLVTDVAPPTEHALGLVTLARFAQRQQDVETARTGFVEALAVRGLGSLVPSLHWPASLSPSSRVALEAVRGLAAVDGPLEAARVLQTLAPAPPGLDGNRLEALRLLLPAATGLSAGTSSGERTGNGDLALVGPGDLEAPACAAHVAVLPRMVAHALVLSHAGRADDALRVLAEVTSIAASLRSTSVATTIEVARVELAVRMRLAESGVLSRQLASGASTLPRLERERMRAFLPEPPPLPPPSDVPTRADAHAVWRARPALNDQAREALVAWGHQALPGASAASHDDAWDAACVALDLVECSALGGGTEIARHGLVLVEPGAWWQRTQARPDLVLQVWVRSVALGVSPAAPPPDLIRQLGVRRAAVTALEEGELLALRLPNEALRLLALALTWFEDARDPVGTWQATLLLLLTRARAGLARETIDLTAMRAAHVALLDWLTSARGAAKLPAWEQLADVATTRTAPTAVDAAWVPWLQRAAAAVQWVQGGVRPEVLLGASRVPLELRDWPDSTAATGSVTRPASVRESAAGVGRPMPSAPPSSAAAGYPDETSRGAAPAPHRSSTASSGRPASRARTMLLMILLITASLVGGFALLGRLDEPDTSSSAPSLTPPSAVAPPPPVAPDAGSAAEPATTSGAEPETTAGAEPATAAGAEPATVGGEPETMSGAEPSPTGADAPGAEQAQSAALPGPAWIVSLLAAGVLLSGYAWRRLRQRSPAAALPEPPWRASITAAAVPLSARVASLDVTLTMADGGGTTVTSFPLRMRRADAFAGLDALRQPPAGTEVSRHYVRGAAPPRVWLTVDVATAWPCWEALLWSGEATDRSLRPAVVRRVPVDDAPVAGPLPAGTPWQVASVVAGHAGERHAAQTWAPLAQGGDLGHRVIAPERVRGGLPQPDVEVVYLVARPLETAQGLYLETATEDHLAVQESLESLKSDRGTLLDASQLTAAFPALRCCVLQPALRPSLDLTEASRELCAQLRIMAATLASDRTTVIVLPPLDADTTTHVLRLLGRRVIKARQTAQIDPHELVARLRTVIVAQGERVLVRDMAIELALQATVYAPDQEH